MPAVGAALAWAAPALLAAALSVAAAPLLADQLSPDYNESVELEGMMGMAVWPGPARGCASVGGHGELRLECALPAGRLTLATDRATYLTITCESDELGLAGSFSCEELEREAGAALRPDAGAEPGILRSVALEGCALPAALACVPALVGARDAAALTLRAPPATLQPRHLAPLAALAHLRILDAGENFTEIPYEALAALPALRRLTVSGGALRLAARWEPPLPRLAMLELTRGSLRAVPPRALAGLPALRNLSLWGNNIDNLTDDSFQGLPELERLSLNSNSLKLLPPGLLQPTPRLKLLHLHGNELEALPRDLVRGLQDLEEVWLNNKNSSELQLDDDTFADLPALHTLKIESCGLRTVPSQLVRGSRALRALSLRGNQLAALPEQLLAEHAALRSLDLARNRLAALPAALLAAARALDRLDLSRNAIATLPRGVFRSQTALTKLDLSRNQIEELHPAMFEGLKSIEELSLSYNRLRMDGGALEAVDAQRRSPLVELRTLRRLQLRNNSLSLFMDDWRDLVYLETLDLSYNAITELTDVDLELLGEAEVDVRHNAIRVVRFDDTRRGTDENLYSKAIFLLDGNPFTCDCFAYKFVVALGRPEVARRFRAEGARCAAPPALAGTPLAAAPPAALACALPAPACPPRCACAVRPATALLELDCAAAPRAAPPLLQYGARGVRLRLRSAAPDLAALPPEVRELDLSGLGLTAAPAPPARVDDLTVDLSDNNLTVAPLELLEAGCRVRLAGNELACDCEHRESIAGLERHWARVVDGPGVRCREGGRVEGSPAARLCAMRDAVVLGGSLAALGLLLAALAALAFRYSTEIRLVLRRYEWLDFLFDDKHALGPEKTFDAFVSFSHRDDDFVRNELVPRLEGGRRPLKLCLHYRDWVVGGIIPQQIDWSVRESRRTIVVLSRAFLESGWGRVEFRAAHGLERVIVVLRGDVLKAEGMDAELRAYLTTNTYVHADDPLVWDRVREAVRRSRSALAPPADKLSHGPLDVQLRDGRLVPPKY